MTKKISYKVKFHLDKNLIASTIVIINTEIKIKIK